MTQLFILLNGKMPDNFNIQNFHSGEFEQCDIFLAPKWAKVLDSHCAQNLAGYDLFQLVTVIETLTYRSKSETLKTKITQMKPGKHVQIFTSSNTSYLIAYCLTQDDIEFLNLIDVVRKELEQVNKEIQEKIPTSLLKKKKELEKQLRNFKK